MSESVTIEILEYQQLSSGTWIELRDRPWRYLEKDEPCKPPDEITLPETGEWCWVSNWRIDKKPGKTDEDGWEYASKLSKFNNANKTKSEKVWNSRVRRRLWCRIMRREVGLGKSTDLQRVMPKIQNGLQAIQQARQTIEEIMKKDPEAINNDQMQHLVQSNEKNIMDITNILDQLDKQELEEKF